MLFENNGGGLGARGSCDPGSQNRDPGHPIPCWVGCVKSNRRSFDSLSPLGGLRSLKMTDQRVGCVVQARLCRGLCFSIVTVGFPGFHPGLFSFPPYGRRAGWNGREAAFGSQLSAHRGVAVYLIFGNAGDGLGARGSCDPGSQKRDPGHPFRAELNAGKATADLSIPCARLTGFGRSR